jgi:hypothetical protein
MRNSAPAPDTGLDRESRALTHANPRHSIRLHVERIDILSQSPDAIGAHYYTARLIAHQCVFQNLGGFHG